MSHLLSLAWLLLWFGAQLLWLRTGQGQRGARRQAYWQTALLVSCLVILLFPVVSNDDDAAWARQIQIDFESVGATQSTRSASRYDLTFDLNLPSSAAALVVLPVALQSYWHVAHETALKPASTHLRSAVVLRGPPSLQF